MHYCTVYRTKFHGVATMRFINLCFAEARQVVRLADAGRPDVFGQSRAPHVARYVKSSHVLDQCFLSFSEEKRSLLLLKDRCIADFRCLTSVGVAREGWHERRTNISYISRLNLIHNIYFVNGRTDGWGVVASRSILGVEIFDILTSCILRFLTDTRTH